LEQSLVDLLLDPARPWIVGLLNVIGVHHQPCDSCPLGPGNSAAVVQAVRQLLTDPRLLVRLGAAPVLLAASGSAAGVGADGRDALLALLRDPPADEGTRRPVSKAFARGEAAHWLVPWVRDPIVREGLLEMLVRDLDEDNRCTLARELEDAASDPVVAQALLQLLADPSAKVQRNAVVGLRGATADAKVRQALLACAGPDRDLEMRSAAVGALDRVADDPVVRAMLLDLLRAPDPELRRAAVTALSGQTADLGVRSALLPCLRDPEDETRSAAVTALRAVVADRGVQEALLWNLDDEYTRAQAVEALSLQIAEPAIRDVLAPVLDGIEIQTEPRLDDGTVALNPFWADERLDMCRTVIEALAEAVPTVALREKLGTLLRDTHFAYSYGY
jgi:hypothetical protein